MNTPTRKIKLPVSEAEVEIKEWITGEEAEYIEAALFENIEINPDIMNKTAKMSKFNFKSINEQSHREIEKFVMSIDGNSENVLSIILKLPESDYEFIKNEISESRKKKVTEVVGQ